MIGVGVVGETGLSVVGSAACLVAVASARVRARCRDILTFVLTDWPVCIVNNRRKSKCVDNCAIVIRVGECVQWVRAIRRVFVVLVM